MPCLHLVNSPQALSECLSLATDADSVLLIGAAAVAADQESARALLALKDDVPDGMTPAAKVSLIDYDRFVELAATHKPIITWR